LEKNDLIRKTQGDCIYNDINYLLKHSYLLCHQTWFRHRILN